MNPHEHSRPRLVGGTEQPEAHHPLLEPSLFYNPPYERPLEDEFAWHLVKYLNPVTALDYQVKVETACAHFWVDFVVTLGHHRVGFECGEMEEAPDEQQLRFREALLLGAGTLDVLYRFRGVDLMHHVHDCLFVASRWDPALFSSRAHVNLGTLAQEEVRACRPGRSNDLLRVRYRQPRVEDVYEGEAFQWPGMPSAELRVRRLSRENPAAWVRDYERALAHYGVSDDDLGTRWARSA